MTSTLPEYSSLAAAVRRGEAALQREEAERGLDVADVDAREALLALGRARASARGVVGRQFL